MNKEQNDYAISNIKQIAENVRTYVSYFDRINDRYGLLEDALTNTEHALRNLVEVMNRLNNRHV